MVYSVHGGMVNNNERVFDSEHMLMFADPVRVSHMYFSGGNLMVAVNVPSIDFLSFDVTDVVQGPGGQVWVRPATVDEVAERLFIQDDSVAGLDGADICIAAGKPIPASECPWHSRWMKERDPFGVLRPEPPDVVDKAHTTFAQAESEAAT